MNLKHKEFLGAILVDYQDGKYFFQVPGRKEFLVTDGFK